MTEPRTLQEALCVIGRLNDRVSDLEQALMFAKRDNQSLRALAGSAQMTRNLILLDLADRNRADRQQADLRAYEAIHGSPA